MAKHFEITITENSFSYRRKTDSIAAEARLDGIYVVRTSVPAETLSAEQAVGAYKSLGPGGARVPQPEDRRPGDPAGVALGR
jgi:hypothetical protein